MSPQTLIGAVCLALGLAILPSFSSGFWIATLTLSVCYAIALAGLGLVYGRLGQVSLVQGALVAIGGWITLRVAHLELPFELALAVGVAGTALVGLVIGLPALRTKGIYLALITLMAAAGAQIMFNRIRFPNGGDGILGAVRSGGEAISRPWLAASDPAYLRYVVITAALAFLVIELHKRGRPGRAWAMIARSEAAAVSAGVNVTLYKSWAFTLSGATAGLCGGLLAGALGVLDPANFRPFESILLFALAVVGGVFSWVGAVIAGLLYRAVPSLLNSWGVDGDIAGIIFGAALLHALITAPSGLAGQLEGLVARLLRRP